MKRILLLFMILLLVGCSNTSNATNNQKEKKVKENEFGITLEQFIENYNENVDILLNNDDYKEKENIPSHINIEDIQEEFEKQKVGYTKNLIKENNDEEFNNYSVTAWYDKDEQFNGLSVNTSGIDSDGNGAKLSAKGVTSAVIILESLGLDRSKVTEFFDRENNDYTYTEDSYKVSFLFDEDTAFLNMKVEKAGANNKTEEEITSEEKDEEVTTLEDNQKEVVEDNEQNESIDTSMFVYAESTDVTDALELNNHVTVFVDISPELTPALATQHVFNQTYDFLIQEKLKVAKTITVAIRQNDVKIVQIEINMDKFTPTNNPNENKIKTVTAASTIAKMPDDVKQYGASTGLW